MRPMHRHGASCLGHSRPDSLLFSIFLSIFVILVLSACPVSAQSASPTSNPSATTATTGIINPTTAAAGATPLASASGYAYAGCWNETTQIEGDGGQRALTGGTTEASNTMTAEACLSFCAKGFNGMTMNYAGLEYGRECYCGANILILAKQIPESHCNFACNGNANELCGGSLTLTLYNLTSNDHSTAGTGMAGWSGRMAGTQAAWYGFLSAGMLVVAAML